MRLIVITVYQILSRFTYLARLESFTQALHMFQNVNPTIHSKLQLRNMCTPIYGEPRKVKTFTLHFRETIILMHPKVVQLCIAYVKETELNILFVSTSYARLPRFTKI